MVHVADNLIVNFSIKPPKNISGLKRLQNYVEYVGKVQPMRSTKTNSE